MRVTEPDEWVTVRKTTKVFGINKAFPLWQFMEMAPDHIKYEIERMARDLGYFSVTQNAERYAQPQVMVHFSMEQQARVTEGEPA